MFLPTHAIILPTEDLVQRVWRVNHNTLANRKQAFALKQPMENKTQNTNQGPKLTDQSLITLILAPEKPCG